MEKFLELIRSGKTDLLEQEIKSNPSLARHKTEQGVSLLLYAAYCRNPSAVHILRRYVPDLDLFEAAALGEKKVVRQHLEKNSELVNSFSADGFTPLGLAAFFGKVEIVEYLLKKGADPNIAANNQFKVAPLHSACATGNIEIVKILLTAGAYVNSRQMQDVTPLHSAAHAGNAELAMLLLDHGADVTAVTTTGDTPLSMALETKSDTVVKLLQKQKGT